jgi:hypothetical protein
MTFAAVMAWLAVSVAGPHAKGAMVDLNGRWTLTAAPIPTDVNPFGSAITISQSAMSVTIADSTMSVTYEADRIDHDLPKATRPANTVAYFTNAATSGVGTYRASLTAAQLVVVRKDSVRLGMEPHQVSIGRVIRQAFTLSGDGSLVIDSLMVTDPLGLEPFNGQAPPENPPSNIRIVYRRAQ